MGNASENPSFNDLVKSHETDDLSQKAPDARRTNGWPSVADMLFIFFLRASSPAPLERMQVIST